MHHRSDSWARGALTGASTVYNEKMSNDSTQRFSNRVADYVKNRPSYPAQVLTLLKDKCALGPGQVVADIGAGTGIFTRLLLDTGATVHAVEPNGPMRQALVDSVSNDSRLCVHDGTAEKTGLGDGSVGLITAAQAYHWFTPALARKEFLRVLTGGRHVALIWNSRLEDTTPFLVAYEELLKRFATDYAKVNHRQVGLESIKPFFAPGPVEMHTFDYQQIFDFEGVKGRLLSSSYSPAEGDPGHAPMLAQLRVIFDQHHKSGKVAFDYKTEVYLGKL
jgi:SAM-dependent methyltransferase